MQKEFHTLDVFSDRRFAGNPLAVLPDARGLSTPQMQAIAREFNYSETTFVLPPESGGDYQVRIFTPGQELPFAGHPTIGTAILLASQQDNETNSRLVLEERAGIVPVTIRRENGIVVSAEFRAPGEAEIGAPVDPDLVAASVGLQRTDLVETAGIPCFAKCGIGFLFAEVRSLDALARVRPSHDLPPALMKAGLDNGVYVFTRATDGPAIDVRARMFAPLHGVFEDPATGSAAAAFAGLMALLDGNRHGEHVWRIKQGVEMGRPSEITVRVIAGNGQVEAIYVSGSAIAVSKGTIDVD